MLHQDKVFQFFLPPASLSDKLLFGQQYWTGPTLRKYTNAFAVCSFIQNPRVYANHILCPVHHLVFKEFECWLHSLTHQHALLLPKFKVLYLLNQVKEDDRGLRRWFHFSNKLLLTWQWERIASVGVRMPNSFTTHQSSVRNKSEVVGCCR